MLQAASAGAEETGRYFTRLDTMLGDSDKRLTVESCDAREREMRDQLGVKIDPLGIVRRPPTLSPLAALPGTAACHR